MTKVGDVYRLKCDCIAQVLKTYRFLFVFEIKIIKKSANCICKTNELRLVSPGYGKEKMSKSELNELKAEIL